MTLHKAQLYVAVTGMAVEGAENVFADRVAKDLDDIGRPVSDLEILRVEPTGNGYVVVHFEDETLAYVNSSRRASRAYLLAQGYQVIDERPKQPLPIRPPRTALRPTASSASSVAGAPTQPRNIQHHTSKLGAVLASPPQGDTLLIESILEVVAEHGAVRPVDLVDDLGQSAEAVDKLLQSLVSAGLVDGSDATVYTLTDAGVAATGTLKGGRKAVVTALVQHGQLSITRLAELLGVTTTVPKVAVRLLIAEGVVESAGEEKGERGRRRVFKLTQHGKRLGLKYEPTPPGRKKTDWEDPTPRWIEIMRVLLTTHEWMTPGAVTARVSASLSAVRTFLRESAISGYMERQVVDETRVTYGYRLSRLGRTFAERYVQDGVVPAEEERVHVKPVDQSAERTLTAISPVTMGGDLAELSPYTQIGAKTRAWVITVTGDQPEALELLAQLAGTQGVTVTEVTEQ